MRHGSSALSTSNAEIRRGEVDIQKTPIGSKEEDFV